MKNNSMDFIKLVWKSPQTRTNYIVSELIREKDSYCFKYCDEVKEALKNGFSPLVPFPSIDEVYHSKNMFPVFSGRLPDKKRRGINEILNKYGMQEYDEFELLKRSGVKLPIDTFSFVNPIISEDEVIEPGII
ncbi:HipA N-terminal domain-containing protein [Clostridium sp. Marseille-P2415]|uniref:HipA N-terminal domain-containing protein n=1 Tax=Clostridium sp. Marseille-P2415 TaxID=1805471 RepID=UPI00098840FA|nr:HipA N-terminal domain-containing protein [Clostridium sp. Marseille-P2415]